MKTREIHPRNLRRGDRVVVSFGIVRVASVHVTTTHYTIRTEDLRTGAKPYEITRAIGNWPEIQQSKEQRA